MMEETEEYYEDLADKLDKHSNYLEYIMTKYK